MAIVYHLCFNVDIFGIMVGSDFNQWYALKSLQVKAEHLISYNLRELA